VHDPVPAIAEADATGETALLFADIRAVLGVGVVNLIWRHLATIEGALPWAWGLLRPAYADGSLAALAARFEASLPPLPTAPLPAEVLACAGLDTAALAAVRGVLRAYARTNPLALLALSALVERLDGAPVAPEPGGAPASASPAPPATTLPLPPLPAPVDLAPATAALIPRLNALGAARPDAVLATMYRHLAHWPPALALSWTLLAPRAADGSLAGAIAACRAAARAAASNLALPAAPPLAEPGRSAVAAGLDRFAGEVLPRMVVACGVLRGGFGPG
jgi:hypothetical protein